jgi:hypothetical protein
MAFNSHEAFKEAAANAAARWKKNPTDELKEQIIATYRLTRQIQKASPSGGGTLGSLPEIWVEAFKDDPTAFDFAGDSGYTY